jgi:hypothetical protein
VKTCGCYADIRARAIIPPRGLLPAPENRGYFGHSLQALHMILAVKISWLH